MAEAPSRSIMLFGTDEPAAETRLLTAGPLTAELDAGNLRYICYGGREAIRAISYVVRNQFWGTFNPEISGLEVEESEQRFTVRYEARCSDGSQTFRYRATITGAADGSRNGGRPAGAASRSAAAAAAGHPGRADPARSLAGGRPGGG